MNKMIITNKPANKTITINTDNTSETILNGEVKMNSKKTNNHQKNNILNNLMMISLINMNTKIKNKKIKMTEIIYNMIII